MWYFLYNFFLVVGSPIIMGILLSKKRCRPGLLQRLGVERPDRPDRQDQPLIWVHAVSLGEVTAVTPLVKELYRRHPDYRFIVSTVTETGREGVEESVASIARHPYEAVAFRLA